MSLRTVIYFKHVRLPSGNVSVEKAGEAKFHEFGCNYEEFENGPGNFSTAIIELPDGTIHNIPVELIQFKIEPAT